MSKGGFLTEMLASRQASSDYGFLWRYVYYMYVGLPLLVTYFLLYQAVCLFIVSKVEGLFGLNEITSPYQMKWTHWVGLMAINLGFVVALYHFKVLPILFVPVKYITSV
jgi:hypothetical protein